MAIAPEDISDDRDLGLRILGYARPVAPCLRALDGEDRETAIAILRPIAGTIERTTVGVKSRTAGDWSWTYLTDSEMGGYFGVDDRAALAALCGTSAMTGRGPIGSFPEPRDYSKVFR